MWLSISPLIAPSLVETADFFIGLLDPLAWLLDKMLLSRKPSANPSAPRYLDENALDAPSLALADASRETLRIGDVVEVMLRQVMVALITNDRARVGEVSRMDNIVDRLDEAIKLYITKLTRAASTIARGGGPSKSSRLPSIWNTRAMSSTRT